MAGEKKKKTATTSRSAGSRTTKSAKTTKAKPRKASTTKAKATPKARTTSKPKTAAKPKAAPKAKASATKKTAAKKPATPKKVASPAKPKSKATVSKTKKAVAEKKTPSIVKSARKTTTKSTTPRKTTRKAPVKKPAAIQTVKVTEETHGLPELSDGVNRDEFYALIECRCHHPHRLLGTHKGDWGGIEGIIIRGWHPDAVSAEYKLAKTKTWKSMRPLGVSGLFGAWMERKDFPLDYALRFTFASGETWETQDPYHFLPSIGDLDMWLHSEGNHYHAYRKFGAQLVEMNGVKGVSFCVWAPNARRVSVIGDFNRWDGRINPMRSMGSSGVWELFVPGVKPGEGYKYEILTQDGHLRYKADPYSFAFDLRPSSHSKIVDLSVYTWKDDEYMSNLPSRQVLQEPVNVYEVHLGSWMRAPEEGNRWLNYRELAHRLVPHIHRYGFTHVELLPVAEHPFDGSWGYQVTGYYAPTSRFGAPEDFKYFVDYMHQHGIGVIVDWVPAHFPRDDFALRWFDGTALYEHEDPRRGEHRDWGTLIFNYGRPEVKNFLLSNALFWLDEYHVDGLRVDAVASMLYLDYSRGPGEWAPNQFGGNENLEAIAFLRQLNEVVHSEYPGRFTVAEESTAFTGVSRPTFTGGLGFTFKWNMGWMNDTLAYFQRDPVYRRHHQGDLTFALVYQYTENFMLPFSHDEVVHGKGSLIQKMPGDHWQKFANLRLLYSYMFAHPGKKLLFQGAEFAQYEEWHYDRSLDWHVAGAPMNKGIEQCLQELGWIYRHNRELWLFDNEPIGFRWIDFSDADSSVISFLREGPEGHILCIFNFTPIPRYGYRIGAPEAGKYAEIFNSDAEKFGGSNLGNHGQVFTEEISWGGFAQSIHMNIPPLGAVYLKYEG